MNQKINEQSEDQFKLTNTYSSEQDMIDDINQELSQVQYNQTCGRINLPKQDNNLPKLQEFAVEDSITDALNNMSKKPYSVESSKDSAPTLEDFFGLSSLTKQVPNKDNFEEILKTAEDISSVNVLKECIALQIKKGKDYQNSNSSVRKADYYPSGVKTIYEMINVKMLRIKSLMEIMELEGSDNIQFESLEDSCKDAINYLSFMVSYIHGKIDGQNPQNDIFNKSMQRHEMYRNLDENN